MSESVKIEMDIGLVGTTRAVVKERLRSWRLFQEMFEPDLDEHAAKFEGQLVEIIEALEKQLPRRFLEISQ